jgi:pyruvate dehydrogenase E1 component
LREFFEVNRYFVVIGSLYALMKEGKGEAKQLIAAMKKFGISSDKLDPLYH